MKERIVGRRAGMFFIQWTSLAVLAIAVSLDSFGVGMTYGLRKIKIPLLSVFIISCCSGIVIWLSMGLGKWLTTYLPSSIASHIGAFILIGLGSFALIQYFRGIKRQENVVEAGQHTELNHNKDEYKHEAEHISFLSTATILRVELKRLGLVIQILKTPQVADVDRSGIISPSEAIMLGIALSLDSFGAGIGAALLGLSALLTAFTISLFSALFLMGGRQLGYKFAHLSMMKYFSFLPGILLIMIGIFKLI